MRARTCIHTETTFTELLSKLMFHTPSWRSEAPLCSKLVWRVTIVSKMPQGNPLLSLPHQITNSYNPDLFLIFTSTLYNLCYRKGAPNMYVSEQMN